jgi:hypothetical protein
VLAMQQISIFDEVNYTNQTSTNYEQENYPLVNRTIYSDPVNLHYLFSHKSIQLPGCDCGLGNHVSVARLGGLNYDQPHFLLRGFHI